MLETIAGEPSGMALLLAALSTIVSLTAALYVFTAARRGREQDEQAGRITRLEEALSTLSQVSPPPPQIQHTHLSTDDCAPPEDPPSENRPLRRYV